MNQIIAFFASLTTTIAILFLTIAALLIWYPELLVTDLRLGMIVICSITGLGMMIPIIVILWSAIISNINQKKKWWL